MLEKKITFDSFIRGSIGAAIAVAIILLLKRLSSVLLPFFIAWLMAYMLYPLVQLLQHRCRLRNRLLSIIATILLVLAALTGIMFLVVPPIVDEAAKFSEYMSPIASDFFGQNNVAERIEHFIQHFINENSLVQIIQQGSLTSALQAALTQTWNLINQTMGFILGIFNVFIVLMYMFFILLDYEAIADGWVRFIPHNQRTFIPQLVDDVKRGMNAYFRGQSLIALIVGVLFSIGFLIIDFPLAIGLGMFIGLLNLVPYLQLIGLVPTVLLALMKSLETGQNFWVILLFALTVFAVVQIIQDMYLTPRIMGHFMGLNPAVILLSLSVWGSLLGLIGLIIALPLTMLCISYYKRFVLHEPQDRTVETAVLNHKDQSPEPGNSQN